MKKEMRIVVICTKRKKSTFGEIFIFPTLEIHFIVYMIWGSLKQKFNVIISFASLASVQN